MSLGLGRTQSWREAQPGVPTHRPAPCPPSSLLCQPVSPSWALAALPALGGPVSFSHWPQAVFLDTQRWTEVPETCLELSRILCCKAKRVLSAHPQGCPSRCPPARSARSPQVPRHPAHHDLQLHRDEEASHLNFSLSRLPAPVGLGVLHPPLSLGSCLRSPTLFSELRPPSTFTLTPALSCRPWHHSPFPPGLSRVPSLLHLTPQKHALSLSPDVSPAPLTLWQQSPLSPWALPTPLLTSVSPLTSSATLLGRSRGQEPNPQPVFTLPARPSLPSL